MENIVFVVLLVSELVCLIIFWSDVKEWFHNRHWNLMGIFGNECPRCHRRYLHKHDMKSCRCRPGGTEDDRGIGVKAPRGKFSGPSAWPPGL